MTIKYLILGNGFLGNKFAEFLEDSVLSASRINSEEDAINEIKKYDPEIVINCIGKTGRPNIDWCENHKLETLHSNVTVPLLLLNACSKLDKRLVHVGSGCIYEGDNQGKGFSENDEPNFFGSFYSRTKIICEKALKDFDILQIRLRMPVDNRPSERNLINKLLTYNKIISIPNSVTIIKDMLSIVKRLMETKETGIFNVVNKGGITHKEILDIYSQITGKKPEYQLISVEDLGKITSARRSNCILSTKKLEEKGIIVPEIKESLKKVITDYAAKGGSK